MTAQVTPFPVASKDDRRAQLITGVTVPLQDNGDFDYGERDMTKADEATMLESIHALMLSNTTLNRALTQRVEQPPPVAVASVAARTPMDRAAAIIPTFLMCATVLYTFAQTKGATETDLKAQVTMALSEAKRAQNNVLLLDTYNRELERAIMQAKTPIKLPTYPVLDK